MTPPRPADPSGRLPLQEALRTRLAHLDEELLADARAAALLTEALGR